MQGRTVLVTGATDGMGKATASRLAARGARVLVLGRNPQKTDAVVAEIRQATPNAAVVPLVADLSTTAEVRRAAAQVRRDEAHLDGVVHAAGGQFPARRTLTAEGLELPFALQYLARFLLVEELLDVLRAAEGPRVLCIAGGGDKSEPVDLDNLQGEKRYSMFAAIRRGATLNDALTAEQIARHPDVSFYNYGPGMVRTKLTMPNPLMWFLLETVMRPFTRSVDQAADDIVGLLTGDHPSGFYGPSLVRREPPATLADPASRERLWARSAALVAAAPKAA